MPNIPSGRTNSRGIVRSIANRDVLFPGMWFRSNSGALCKAISPFELNGFNHLVVELCIPQVNSLGVPIVVRQYSVNAVESWQVGDWLTYRNYEERIVFRITEVDGTFYRTSVSPTGINVGGSDVRMFSKTSLIDTGSMPAERNEILPFL